MRRTEAFTLVEVLIVAAIIAAVCGIVAANLHRGAKNERTRQAAMTFAEHLRYARVLAIDQERPARVVMDTKAATYRVELAENVLATAFKPAAGPAALAVHLPQGVVFERTDCGNSPDGQTDVFWFQPTGNWPSGKVWIGNGESRNLVALGPALGRVHVIELPPGAWDVDHEQDAGVIPSLP